MTSRTMPTDARHHGTGLPIRLRSGRPRFAGGVAATRLAARVALGVVLVASQALPAAAQDGKVRIIRDAEIENLLRDYVEPIFRTAGISSRDSEVVVVDDRSFNAFVASGSRMFITTGALVTAKTPNEVIGVLAHETGHLAGGHLQGLRNELARAKAIALLAAVLGTGAMIAAGGGPGTQAGAAAAAIGPAMALRSLLSYRRAQETAADRAALTYLNATGQSARGMITTFRRFADQALFAARYTDPYVQSHPMPTERIGQLEDAASRSRYWDAVDPPELQLRHDMMRAKISAFMESPRRVGRRFSGDDNSLPARYARAIIAHRTGSLRGAIRQIDALIQEHPRYPYFHELKGQALLESGRAKEAIAPLRQATALAPDAGLIRIMLGHALLESNNPANLDEAIGNLRTGLNAEPLSSDGYRHLATALARQDRIAEAEVATAHGLVIEGDIKAAQNYAKRAQAKLKRGSPGWLQADDILSMKVPDSDK